MIRKFLFLPALTVALQAVRAGIDLTPMPGEYRAEGITIQQLIFIDDKRKVTYEPPRHWSWRGGADWLQLTPAGTMFAEASIRARPLAVPQLLDGNTMLLLKEKFLNSLPPGSQKINLLKEEQNPVVLDNKLSYAVTASYQVIGETFVRTALFVNLADTQLCFTMTARQNDFEKLNQSFRTSILSWHWIEESRTAQNSEPTIVTAPASQTAMLTN